jgi:hypothetical protein
MIWVFVDRTVGFLNGDVFDTFLSEDAPACHLFLIDNPSVIIHRSVFAYVHKVDTLLPPDGVTSLVDFLNGFIQGSRQSWSSFQTQFTLPAFVRSWVQPDNTPVYWLSEKVSEPCILQNIHLIPVRPCVSIDIVRAPEPDNHIIDIADDNAWLTDEENEEVVEANT